MAPAIVLDHTFAYKSQSHEFSIQWTRQGNQDAPALVFIHGTPWSSFEWFDLTANLSSRYSVYLYDHPGFGQSASPRRLSSSSQSDREDIDGALRLRAEASAALIQHWDIRGPIHVVAHDNGGLVALRLLLQHKIIFASLCLINVVAIGPFGLPLFKLVAENRDVFLAIPPHIFEGIVRAYVKNATYKPLPQETEDILCKPWLVNGEQGPTRFIDEMIQAHNRDTSDIEFQYSRAGEQIPIKIMWGANDSWIPVESAHRLYTALNAKELVIVDEAGHLSHFDQPAKVTMELALWLGQNKGA